MKSVSAGMTSALAASRRRLCWFAKLKRDDGTIAAFSQDNVDRVFDLDDGDGAVTYPAASVIRFAALSSSVAAGEPDETELEGAFQDGVLTRADVVAQLWRGAEARIFRVNLADLGDDAIKELRGACGSFRISDFGWSCEVLGLKARLQRRIVKAAQQYCRAEFGTVSGFDFCGRVLLPADRQDSEALAEGDFRRNPSFDDRDYKCVTAGTTGAAPPTWDTTIGNTFADGTATLKALRAVQVTGTIATPTSRLGFTVTGFAQGEYPDQWFQLGDIAFTSGPNAGVSRTVASWDSSSGSITLALPLPFDPEAGDGFTLTAGCNKTKDEGVNSCTAHDNFAPAAGKGGFRGEERILTLSEQMEIKR